MTARTEAEWMEYSLAPIADCIASAHRNSNMPDPEFKPLTLDTVRERIWELSYEINRLRALVHAAQAAPDDRVDDGLRGPQDLSTAPTQGVLDAAHIIGWEQGRDAAARVAEERANEFRKYRHPPDDEYGKGQYHACHGVAERIRALKNAAQAAPDAPQGLEAVETTASRVAPAVASVLVPSEPTEAMLYAGVESMFHQDSDGKRREFFKAVKRGYSAMLAAAPAVDRAELVKRLHSAAFNLDDIAIQILLRKAADALELAESEAELERRQAKIMLAAAPAQHAELVRRLRHHLSLYNGCPVTSPDLELIREAADALEGRKP